jgi:hypothetical protein
MAPDSEIPTRKRIGGRFSDIFLSLAIVTMPMLLLSGVILALVFHYRVAHNNAPFEDLHLPEAEDEPGIYYVDLNATFLVFIASWSSTVAPMLASFVLILAAYPICREYLNEARANRTEELLTPYQLALTLRFANGGGFGALWSWLKYLFQWKKERQPQGKVLSTIAALAIFASSLG